MAAGTDLPGPRRGACPVGRAGRGAEEGLRRLAAEDRAVAQGPRPRAAMGPVRQSRGAARSPEQLAKVVASTTAPEATRKVSQAVIQRVAELVPNLVGGSADLDPSTFTYIKDGGDVKPGEYGGRNVHFGVREHGMGAMVNGFAYDGFFIPFGATFLLFSDYMRPPIRLAALSRLQSLFVYTHDSIFLGE